MRFLAICLMMVLSFSCTEVIETLVLSPDSCEVDASREAYVVKADAGNDEITVWLGDIQGSEGVYEIQNPITFKINPDEAVVEVKRNDGLAYYAQDGKVIVNEYLTFDLEVKNDFVGRSYDYSIKIAMCE